MKVFAIGSLAKAATPEELQQIMPKEAQDTLQLYLDSVIEQFWFRQDSPGVVFLMSVDSIEKAKEKVSALPLAKAGFLKFELIPVGPLAPLGRLIHAK